ncbi:hypothetical protein KPH14_008801 [Odynerus spinipes]|uniref:Uncharacterized protein n=1 Tax=Odynerus spinipes TaxID=1348599 RepID=A0AAD9R918_9HYME|nr:hypothetical protein KPH14_008801 [Odynerus spinipes]
MKRVPIISTNSAYLKKDDCTFFVLRNKVSTSKSTNNKDIFCVVRDSYANLLYKDIKNGRLSYENNGTHKYDFSFPSKQTVFDLRLFREYLTFFFAIHPNSNISYMDNKNKLHVVETETEFLELWKLAKKYSKRSRGVLLLIDSTKNQGDSMICNKDKIPIADDEEGLSTGIANLFKTSALNENTAKVKEHNDVRCSNGIFNFGESNNDLLNNKEDASTSHGDLTTSYSKILTKEVANIKLESIIPSDINSQDFVNNAPPIWFVRYMKQLKKDIITEVSDKIMANVMENLNECSMKSSMHTQHKISTQCENQVCKHRSKCNHERKNLLMDQRRQHKSIVKTEKKKEKKLKQKLEYNSEDDDNRENGNYNRTYNTSVFPHKINNIYEFNDIITENKTVNGHDSVLPDFLSLQPSSKENLYTEPNLSNMANESEFRMNCSITEHQMLDKKHFESKTCCCGSDTENISIHSYISNGEEFCNEFEMISKPIDSENNTCYMKDKVPLREKLRNIFYKNRSNENTKDTQSFEVLPEMLSSLSSSICIEEDHFTTSTNIPTSVANDNLNISITHKSDGEEYSACENKKICSGRPFDVSNKYTNSDVKEFTNKICNKLIESTLIPTHEKIDLLHTDFDLESRNTKINVNNSHTSYMTTEPTNAIYSDYSATERNIESQTDLNDLTQSFHSHTTLINDNGVYDIRETNTSTSHDYSKHSLSDPNKLTNSKENKIHEQIKKDFTNKNPEKKVSREESNAKNGGRHEIEDTAANSISGTAEPVHILPEKLVNGTLHLASFVYGTARKALVKNSSNIPANPSGIGPLLSWEKRRPRRKLAQQ